MEERGLLHVEARGGLVEHDGRRRVERLVGDDDVEAGTVGVNPRGGEVERDVPVEAFVELRGPKLAVSTQVACVGETTAHRAMVLLGRVDLVASDATGRSLGLELGRAAGQGARGAMSPDEIAENFDLGHHTKHVDTIFARVFGPT